MKTKTKPSQARAICAVGLALGLLGDTIAQAQFGGVPLWTNYYNGPANGDDLAKAMAVDGSGNVFVTGFSYGSGSGVDYLTIKYSSAGTALWTNRYNGPGNRDDIPKSIAVDGGGNVFVTGSSTGTGGNYDYATIKYSEAGVPLWTNLYNGPGNGDDRAFAVAVDGSGNVFVTGFSLGASNDYDYATIKYSSAGTALWTNRYNGPGNSNDYAFAMAVDGSGNVFVTGKSYGTNGYYDYATLKYSSAGTALWTNRYHGPGNGDDSANAVAVDGSGNVFVTGQSAGSGSGFDYATIKYSSAGTALWTNRYNGPGDGDDVANAVAVDGSGNVFVTGFSYGSGGDDDYATIKYSSDGTALWTNRYSGTFQGDDEARAVAVDGSGNVFVTGRAYYSTYGDYTTIAYSGAGVPLWTNLYDGPGNGDDAANAVAVDGSGNVFVTGYSGNGSSFDYVTIKYSAVPPSLTIAHTTTNTVAVSWPSPSTGWNLQVNSDPTTTNWSTPSETVQDNGTSKLIIVSPPDEKRFYRLKYP
jgi:hypothetical protein